MKCKVSLTKDYEVFQPSNEHLAQMIVGILEGRGYDSSYQLGYPNNKIFIKVDNKEEADKISRAIGKFMQKHTISETGIPSAKLNILISKLASLIPAQAAEQRKTEEIEENIQKNIENKIPEASETESTLKSKLEESRSEITERIKFLNAQMTKNPNDPSNEGRTIECETLNWVLRIMP
jgi:hypothetical protein